MCLCVAPVADLVEFSLLGRRVGDDVVHKALDGRLPRFEAMVWSDRLRMLVAVFYQTRLCQSVFEITTLVR